MLRGCMKTDVLSDIDFIHGDIYWWSFKKVEFPRMIPFATNVC